mmetsp:Transcript_3299/g.6268  ORF Transcript_3299/g.6268 Transcript_3299/m.6268 type:complete len:233 (+) Transcript_3299:49-747(+)
MYPAYTRVPPAAVLGNAPKNAVVVGIPIENATDSMIGKESVPCCCCCECPLERHVRWAARISIAWACINFFAIFLQGLEYPALSWVFVLTAVTRFWAGIVGNKQPVCEANVGRAKKFRNLAVFSLVLYLVLLFAAYAQLDCTELARSVSAERTTETEQNTASWNVVGPEAQDQEFQQEQVDETTVCAAMYASALISIVISLMVPLWTVATGQRWYVRARDAEEMSQPIGVEL